MTNTRRICASLTFLEGKEQDYLTQQGFTAENVLVKQVHEQIEQTEALKKDLEEKYPKLAALNVPLSSPVLGQQADASIDLKTESEQVTGLKAKIQALNLQLNQVWAEATNFEKVETTISELEQKKQVEEANLKYFMSNLEETRIDEALGGDKAANISIIQAPSPPGKGWSKRFQKEGGNGGGRRHLWRTGIGISYRVVFGSFRKAPDRYRDEIAIAPVYFNSGHGGERPSSSVHEQKSFALE